MKHMVDRYNIYFAYGPSKIDKDIHASAINFVMVAVILLQCTVCFFDILRAGNFSLLFDQQKFCDSGGSAVVRAKCLRWQPSLDVVYICVPLLFCSVSTHNKLSRCSCGGICFLE